MGRNIHILPFGARHQTKQNIYTASIDVKTSSVEKILKTVLALPKLTTTLRKCLSAAFKICDI